MQYFYAPEQRLRSYAERKQTSFKDEVEARTIDEGAVGDEEVFESDDDDDVSESAIDDDDDDSSDWEDSATESGRTSVEEKPLFQRVDSRPTLTSRRSLLTDQIHQSQRAAALANVASRSTPAMQRSRASSPNGPSVAASPNDAFKVTLNDAFTVTLDDAFEATLNDAFKATFNDAFKATLNDAFKAILSNAFKAKTAAHKAEMDRHTVAWKGAVDRANRRCHEAEEKLEKEREQSLALVSPNERCHDPLANAQLAAEQSVRDAHDIGSAKDGRLAEPDIDMLATMNREWDAKLIINGITILNTEVNRLAKEQELKLRDQLREIISLASGDSALVRTAFAPHGTTPSSRASQTSDTAPIHPDQSSTSARTDEHTKGFDGVL